MPRVGGRHGGVFVALGDDVLGEVPRGSSPARVRLPRRQRRRSAPSSVSGSSKPPDARLPRPPRRRRAEAFMIRRKGTAPRTASAKVPSLRRLRAAVTRSATASSTAPAPWGPHRDGERLRRPVRYQGIEVHFRIADLALAIVKHLHVVADLAQHVADQKAPMVSTIVGAFVSRVKISRCPCFTMRRAVLRARRPPITHTHGCE